MVSSVNILVPPKTAAKKPKGEAKSLGTKDKKTQAQDMGMVEVPAKREAPKKEKKKIQSVRRKNAPKNSVRKRKESNNQEANTPSIRTKKAASPAPSEEKVPEKKKDEGSKNETKVATKTPKKPMNLELATKFFKQMATMESQRQKKEKTKEEDVNLETMPESSGLSKRSKKTHKHGRGRHEPLDRNIFKENGEPIWVVPDRKPGDKQVFNEEGELVKNPELMAALEDEQLEMEDGKGWILKITSFLGGEMTDWKNYTKEETQENMDPFASDKVLEKRSQKFFSKEAVVYNTSDAILQLSHNAIERFSQQNEDTCPRRIGPPSRESDPKEEEEKTCIDTSIRFNSGPMFCISYDRRDPISSIRKFKRRYRELLKLSLEVEKKEKEVEKEVEKDKDETHTKREELKKEEEKKEDPPPKE